MYRAHGGEESKKGSPRETSQVKGTLDEEPKRGAGVDGASDQRKWEWLQDIGGCVKDLRDRDGSGDGWS